MPDALPDRRLIEKATPARAATPDGAAPRWLTLLLAAACGLLVANIYYAQPLIGPIAADLGLSPGAAGLIVTMTQIGYGIGLLLVVPLGDLIENRRLILGVTSVCVVALAAAAAAPGAAAFLAAALAIGLGAVAVQILVPYAAHLAPPARRGRMVGTVMSGLLVGVMLARPAASLVTHLAGWRAVYVASALATAGVAATVAVALPPRLPARGRGYGALLASLLHLALTTPVLRRRAAYHAALFGAFSLFWTTVPLLLAGPGFGLTQGGIALFGFAGAAGAAAAPVAGRLADRGFGRSITTVSMALCVVAFALTLAARPLWAGTQGGGAHGGAGMAVLVAAAVLLDMGVCGNLIVGQRAIFALGDAVRARLNGLFMAAFFAAGAAGSALGAWAYAIGGWGWAASIGIVPPALVLLWQAGEYRRGPARQSSASR